MQKILLLTSALGLLVCSACNRHQDEKEATIQYAVTSPITIDTSVDKSYVAQIRSVQNIEIRAQERGFLQKMYTDEGQYVRKGQLLFKIMPNLTQAESEKAKAELTAAQVEYQNVALLADKDIVSKNELAVAKAKVAQAKASLSLANTHLAFTDIRAPFDGVLDRIPKKLGSLIDEGELLTSLSDNSKMFVYFNVTEPEYLNFMMNKDNPQYKKVRLQLANNQIFNQEGSIETMEGEFNPETGNIAFRATFPNMGHLLKNGQTGKVLMNVPLKNAMVIPQKASYEVQDKKYVFVVDKAGKAHAQLINVLASMPDLYVVDKGLNLSDIILLEGVQSVKEGQKVKVQYKPANKVLASLSLKAE